MADTAKWGCGGTASHCSLRLEMLQFPLGAKFKGYQITWLVLSCCYKLFCQFVAQAQLGFVTKIITGTTKPGVGTPGMGLEIPKPVS